MVVTEERLAEGRRTGAERDWRRRVALAWVVSITALIGFEPTPTNVNAVEPLWATVTAYAFLGLLTAMAVGLSRKQRWAFGASSAAGVLGMGLAYACLASGHHLGAWWLIELSTFGALTALGIAAAERSKP